MQGIGVVVAHDRRAVVAEIAALLDHANDLLVVGTTPDAPGDVLVAGGEQLARVHAGRPLVALASEDPIRAARLALSAGAREILRWPQDSARLPDAIRAAAAGARAQTRRHIVAVAGARGGVGASTVAACLAAASGALVVDLDAVGAGQRGLADAEPWRTLDDVWPVLLDGGTVDLSAIAVPHAGGARAVHVGAGSSLDAGGVPALVRSLGGRVVVDCGRAADAAAWAMFDAADERLVVLTDDVASIRGALSLRDAAAGPVRFVLRRIRRRGVARRDVRVSLGDDPVVVPRDAALARALDLGRLPVRATRACRAIGRIARSLEAVA